MDENDLVSISFGKRRILCSNMLKNKPHLVLMKSTGTQWHHSYELFCQDLRTLLGHFTKSYGIMDVIFRDLAETVPEHRSIFVAPDSVH